jgi:3-hydroxy-9,10-secoandrosta-1,3,5(10)-triene-9,17-dione monooxygenase
MSTTSDGEPEPVVVLIPMSDLENLDDWDTAGLRGTGSVTTVANEVFVPIERVLSVVSLLQGQVASKLNAEAPIYQSPMIPTIAAAASGAPLGLAKAAMTSFLQRLPGRRITYTNYENQAGAPITHFQVAEVSLKIDEAEFHAYRAATLVDRKTASGEAWTVEERCRVRLDTAQVARLAKEAIDLLNSASGGSSIYNNVPIQRIQRDIQAVNLQGMIQPNTNLELYGRVLCGLEPNTFNI